MARVLRFYTTAFDFTKERPNPINPIPGESLLLWLIDQAKGSVEISAPDTEDWGWYSYAEWKGRKYMLGASACDEEEDGQGPALGCCGRRHGALRLPAGRVVPAA